MLQIPSSTLSLFSFSFKGLVGLLGGFCIGVQVTASILLSSLSVAKNSATRTVEIILLPTKCDPSNGAISFPYVALIAYATAIFASLFCILRAKGFTSSCNSTCNQPSPHGELPSPDDPLHSNASPRAFSPARNRNGISNHPPSPPPEPDSSGSMDEHPRRNSWLFWLLCLLMAVLLLLGIAGIYICFTDNHSRAELLVVASRFIQPLSFLETGLFDSFLAVQSYIFILKIYLFLHGLHHLKLFLFGMGAYSALIFIDRGCHRLRVRVGRRTSIGSAYLAAVFETFAVMFIASCPPLRWILWAPYYYFDGCLFRVSWCSFSLAEKSMILGPALIQLTVTAISTACFILFQSIAPAFSVFSELLTVSRLFAVSYTIVWGPFFAVAFYFELPPDHTRLIWKYPFLSLRWRQEVLGVYRIAVWEYRDWKSTKIKELHNIISFHLSTLAGLFNFCLETWGTLYFVQKLASHLIVAPPAIYCGHFYIIPAARRISLLIRN
ncbi:hypothetical protein DFH09DRAFT_1420229 [Mycena vulgaris]|nr:hypothetical protein DFH09DRAFT_1420229 [Mycena vulgaris]